MRARSLQEAMEALEEDIENNKTGAKLYRDVGFSSPAGPPSPLSLQIWKVCANGGGKQPMQPANRAIRLGGGSGVLETASQRRLSRSVARLAVA
jgi:hypothetical protein